MSPSIWTRCEGRSRLRRLSGRAWRVVEYQYLVSTRKLVASDEEQRLLEDLLEQSKPAAPAERLHFLLSTPFRYPPLRHGSRFRRRTDPGVWYGSQEQRTAFAEIAYYRLLFLEGTEAQIAPVELDLSAFRASYDSSRAVDLTKEPFAAHRAAISSPRSYAESHRLAGEMREAGVALARYFSARDGAGGVNVAILAPGAFREHRPEAPETWRCVAARTFVELTRKDIFVRETLRFERGQFEIEGALPHPGL